MQRLPAVPRAQAQFPVSLMKVRNLFDNGSITKALVTARRRFRASLRASDHAVLRSVRVLWLCAQFVPMAAYYGGASDAKPKFPATISWTIRKGVPRACHHCFWIAGWLLLLTPLQKRASNLHKAFSVTFFLWGMSACMIYELGRSKNANHKHVVSAGVFMALHHLHMVLFGARITYLKRFWASFGSFAAGLWLLARVEKAYSIEVTEGCSEIDKAKYEAERNRLSPRQRLTLKAVELIVMVGENLLFLWPTLALTSYRQSASLGLGA